MRSMHVPMSACMDDGTDHEAHAYSQLLLDLTCTKIMADAWRVLALCFRHNVCTVVHSLKG